MCSEHLDRNLPQFYLNQVKAIVAELYCIDGDYKELNCERDITYRICTKIGATYIVKISNAAEPEGVVDFQIKALKHIAEQDSDLRVPHMIHTKDDKPFEWIQSDNGDRHMIRMLTFMEGDVMDHTPAAFKPKTRYNLGVMVDRLTKSLRNFFHLYAGSNVHLWDMSRCLELRPYIRYLPDGSTRELCNIILDRAERFILPQLKKTRWQVVHHDAHPDNVLVDPKDPTRVVGIIDFGDMLFGPVVADLAVAGDSFDDDDTDPMDALCDTTAGYDSSFPLEENEIDLVYDMMLIALLPIWPAMGTSRLSLWWTRRCAATAFLLRLTIISIWWRKRQSKPVVWWLPMRCRRVWGVLVICGASKLRLWSTWTYLSPRWIAACRSYDGAIERPLIWITKRSLYPLLHVDFAY